MLHASSSENLRLGVDPWIPRLPTPGLDPGSPSMSRVSSMASLRSEAELGGERYSHLRPLPSPLPHPIATNHSVESIASSSNDDDPTSSPTSGSGSKTNAFFSSPFSIAIVRNAPSTLHHPPGMRATSLTLPAKTDVDQARSVFYEPPSLDSESEQPDDVSAMMQPLSRVASESQASSQSRSQTASASFWGPSRAASLTAPKPPPNLEPITTGKKSGASGLPGFPSLSRFFPSRGRSNEADAHNAIDVTEPSPTIPDAVPEQRPSVPPREASPSPSRILTVKRSFVELRPEEPGRTSLDDDAWCVSPTASTSSNARLQVPSPTRARQASPERLLAHAHWAKQRAQASPPSHSTPTTAGLPPLRRETDMHKDFPTPEAMPGQVIGSPQTPLKLIKLLGHGAFSSVWLATDETAELALTRSASIDRGLSRQGSAGKRVVKRRRPSESWAKKESDRKMGGLKPHQTSASASSSRPTPVAEEEPGPTTPRSSEESGDRRKTSPFFTPKAAPPKIVETLSQRQPAFRSSDSHTRVVAVKMMDRVMCDANDRTRISFVREVEILRHISHPSIVSYLHSFTTATHHCLVLEQVAGGELFDMLNNDQKHARLTEPLLRRMWSELCRAVAWMHSVALVHRDIKLENILLTCNPFAPEYLASRSPLASPSLQLLPSPLLKLTDFGLSRFIDPDQPLLSTRCGSESYAAPEIVMATKYDGRQTDAWACGVVLFALATRILPFDRVAFGGGSSVGSVSEYGGSSSHGTGQHDRDRDSVMSSIGASASASGRGRRSYLIRIAKSEYAWPTEGATGQQQRLATPGLKKVVERLLVRDPKKRATVAQIWDEEWMSGEGGLPRPGEGSRIHIDEPTVPADGYVNGAGRGDETLGMPTPTGEQTELALEVQHSPSADDEASSAEVAEDVESPDPSSGLLVNGESISNVARFDTDE